MKTKLIVLGVNHSYQLVSKECQPAAYRAFFDRINPAVIGLERSPNEFSTFDFYDFTYEQQDIVMPYSIEKGIPVHPFDWIPSSNDQSLAWNIGDIEQPPFIRGKETYKNFLYFPELEEDFFYSERKEIIGKIEDWTSSRSEGEADFPRRLFLYRTYMQAMRIKAIAKEFQGQTVLVVVGHMHKKDIEDTLKEIPFIDIIQPSEYEYPSEQEITNNLLKDDLLAICSFNLLGLQSNYSYDVQWVEEIVKKLSTEDNTSEMRLFATRLAVLKKEISGDKAIKVYEDLLSSVRPDEKFTYTGVKDESRIDSFFDPFGNMTVENRLQVELARENYKLGKFSEADIIKSSIHHSTNLSVLQKKQLEVYWDEYLYNYL